MAVITIPYSFTNGATIYAAEHNSNFTTIYNEFNGNIDNANIKSTAAIVDTKLNQITTAGKVSGAALTALASTPTSAGYLPIACGGLGTGMAGVTSGSMLYFSAVGTISAFASGTSGKYLMTTGASSSPIWNTISITSGTIFGTWSASVTGTVYQAATDGFVTAYTESISAGNNDVIGYADATTAPSIVRIKSVCTNAGESASISFPVKKNDYWKVDSGAANGTVTVFWLPSA